MIKFRYKRDLD